MLKKSVVALFGLLFAMALITPPKASAQVVFRVGVGPVVVGNAPVVVAPAPPVVVAPAPVVVAPGYPPYVYPGVNVGVGFYPSYAYRYGGWRGHGWRR